MVPFKLWSCAILSLTRISRSEALMRFAELVDCNLNTGRLFSAKICAVSHLYLWWLTSKTIIIRLPQISSARNRWVGREGVWDGSDCTISWSFCWIEFSKFARSKWKLSDCRKYALGYPHEETLQTSYLLWVSSSCSFATLSGRSKW